MVASPFWFMLFFLRCFFLSVTGEEEPTSLVEEELDTPSTAESGQKNTKRHHFKCKQSIQRLRMPKWKGPSPTNTLSRVRQCRGTSLHTSVTPQEQRTTQSFHFLHLQKAAGAYRDWKDDSKHALNNRVFQQKYVMKKKILKLDKNISGSVRTTGKSTWRYGWRCEVLRPGLTPSGPGTSLTRPLRPTGRPQAGTARGGRFPGTFTVTRSRSISFPGTFSM